jgi:RHS repeat-associated protein
VRQATDVQGAVTAAREWTPYGVEMGGAQPGLGYAGEWFDAHVEAQYLRARWYDVATGRFMSEDVWEGDKYQPLTLHAYLYALATPMNLADASGMRPQPDSTYSCNCGFIDEDHLDANPGSTAYDIIQLVEESTAGYQFTYRLPNGKVVGKWWIGQCTDIKVRIKRNIDMQEKHEVALGIFQALENASEEGVPQTVTGSRYSEEDLVSNLLGFYFATLQNFCSRYLIPNSYVVVE